jgi:hypothetical protein
MRHSHFNITRLAISLQLLKHLRLSQSSLLVQASLFYSTRKYYLEFDEKNVSSTLKTIYDRLIDTCRFPTTYCFMNRLIVFTNFVSKSIQSFRQSSTDIDSTFATMVAIDYMTTFDLYQHVDDSDIFFKYLLIIDKATELSPGACNTYASSELFITDQSNLSQLQSVW